MQKKAEPLQAIKGALAKLEPNKPTVESIDLQESVLSTHESAVTTGQSPRKRTLEQNVSPKRQKTNTGAVLEVSVADAPTAARASDTDTTEPPSAYKLNEGSIPIPNETKHSIRFQLAPQQRPSNDAISVPAPSTSGQHEQPERPSETGAAGAVMGKGLSALPKVARKPFSPLPMSASKPARAQALLGDSASRMKKRPPLLSKTPRLSRIGLSGRAQRADPDQSIDLESESDSETESTRPTGIKQKSKSNVKKMDLSYMMDWDPTAPRESATKEYPAASATKPRLCKIDEGTPSLSSSTGSGVTPGASTASISLSHHANGRRTSTTSDGVNTLTPLQPLQRTPQRQELYPSEAAALVAKSNRDFLPLVSEDNMLRVNGVPYAKLGVIGKGGSCKVYRALSKDCSVLAIKKVKLEGMDKKAIDGYANEIALLKRLRGNPAIIQMFDSEVDLGRKAIFVAMEVGEVDLNHVLQQQTLLRERSGGDERRSLNMNFIRLTWQQMLSAVHCIHEERIIHGDLKPANFLFVRGALKLIDFGIAKAIQNDDTNNIYRETQIGTLNYMSPEAILDTGSGQNGARMKIGRASDIWSLGCILYQMVYGQTPFAELHMIPKLQAIVNPNHAIRFPNNVDEVAIDAIKQCLRRNSADRPPIVGVCGLLNEHRFLNSRQTRALEE